MVRTADRNDILRYMRIGLGKKSTRYYRNRKRKTSNGVEELRMPVSRNAPRAIAYFGGITC